MAIIKNNKLVMGVHYRNWWYKISTRVVTCKVTTRIDLKRLFDRLDREPVLGILPANKLGPKKFKNAEYFTLLGVVENGETRKVSFRMYASKDNPEHTGIHITGISLIETFEKITRSVIKYFSEWSPDCFSTLDYEFTDTNEIMTNIQSILCTGGCIDLESLHARLTNQNFSLKPLGTKNASSIILNDGLSCTIYKYGSLSFKPRSSKQLDKAQKLFHSIQECLEDIVTPCTIRQKNISKYDYITYDDGYILLQII